MMYNESVKYTVVFYESTEGHSQPLEYLARMKEKHEVKAKKWLQLLQEQGPDLPRPYADIVDKEVRELRVPIEHHQHRFLYVIHGKMIIVTNAFLKKTNEVPPNEVERARRLFRDWSHRGK